MVLVVYDVYVCLENQIRLRCAPFAQTDSQYKNI